MIRLDLFCFFYLWFGAAAPHFDGKFRLNGVKYNHDNAFYIKTGYNEMLKENSAMLYKSGKITLSEAARRAGLTLWEMEHYLVDSGFKSDYSIEDLQREMELLKRKITK